MEYSDKAEGTKYTIVAQLYGHITHGWAIFSTVGPVATSVATIVIQPKYYCENSCTKACLAKYVFQ